MPAALPTFLPCLTALSFAVLSSFAAAQDLPKPIEQPFPGVITLKVDATDLAQKIFRVKESIPVKAGKMTLLYPKWLPGNHSPNGPIVQLGGLLIKGNGKAIEWKRDPVEVFAFHLDVPAGVSTLEVEFQYLSPVEKDQGRITVTPEIVGVQWSSVVLYPASHVARGITVQANLRLPHEWQFGSALEAAGRVGDEVHFKPTNLTQLVDSPLFAGKYFKRFDLDPGAKIPVFLNVVADNAAALDAKPAQVDIHRALVQQAYKLYQSQHYGHYDFLLSLSDEFSGIGLEHHQSSENGVKPTYFTEWDKNQVGRDLLAHEYTHSWDGKFRRPAGQFTANFTQPMENSLLWVYEGQTQYWGYVLAARSGLMSTSQVRDAIAAVAAFYDQLPARGWRPMQDTTNDPVISGRGPLAWPSWQRAEDYYSEGQLIWLDADTKIRELSNEQRSLNDFASSFFGVKNGSFEPLAYQFDDVVKALNAVQPYDWASFLRSRLDGHGPGAPLDGLARAGWKLVYTDTPSEFSKGAEEMRKNTGFAYSLGFNLSKDAKTSDILWDGPAFKAGLTEGMTVLAVDGRSYKPELLKDAIKAAVTGKQPIELLLKKDDRYQTVRIDYHGGLKYPHLERIAGTPDRLETILQPLK